MESAAGGIRLAVFLVGHVRSEPCLDGIHRHIEGVCTYPVPHHYTRQQVADSINRGDAGRRFSIVSLSALVVFATLFTLAIAKSRRVEVHKRLMLLAMIPLMHAAMARVFLTLFAPPGAFGPPPVFVSVAPGLVVDLLIVVAVIHDWRRRGRVHPVYLIGGFAIFAVQVLCVPASATATWLSIARSVEALAG